MHLDNPQNSVISWEKSPTTEKREEIFPADEDRHILTILYVGRYIAHTPCTSEKDQVKSYTYTLSAWKGTEHFGTYTCIEIRKLDELYNAVEMKHKELSRE